MWYSVGLGVLLGIVYLTRYIAIFLLPVAIIGVWVGASSWSKRLISLGLLMSSALLVILPWLIYNTAANGSSFASENWRNLALALYGSGDFNYLDKAAFDGYLAILFADPAGVIKLWVDNALNTVKAVFFLHTSSIFLAVFLPVGIFHLAKHSISGRVILIYALVYPLSFILSFQYFPRFLLPVIPVMIMLAVVGVSQLFGFRPIPQWIRVIIVEMILIAPLIYLFGDVRAVLATQPVTEMDAVNELIAAYQGPGAIKLSSTYRFVDYFSSAPESLQHTWMPEFASGFPETLLASVESSQADFVLVSDRTTSGALRDGSIDRLLPDCWIVIDIRRDISGETRIYTNDCEPQR